MGSEWLCLSKNCAKAQDLYPILSKILYKTCIKATCLPKHLNFLPYKHIGSQKSVTLIIFYNSQGSILTAIGLLGTLLSCTVIYLLLYRRVRLAKCQSLFIINLSISDVFVSILGFFRGLGIIDSRFVGAVHNKATPYCAVYSLFLGSLGVSNVIALLPLTIDRAIAVMIPLRHGSIITHKTCAGMLVFVWSAVLIVIVNYLVELKNGTVVDYNATYHRCNFNKSYQMEFLFLMIIPFTLIVLMYGSMLFVIVKTEKSCGRFLLFSTAIIATNILCFTPQIITSLANVRVNYMASQVLFVTAWYLNGIFNPLIYFINHPKTRDFVRSSFARSKKVLEHE